MPQTPPTPLMTAWADFPGPYSSDPHKIQATIYYCASRFRAASISILQTADEAAQTNMVDCLDVEVVRMIPAPLAQGFNTFPDVLPPVPRDGGRNRISG